MIPDFAIEHPDGIREALIDIRRGLAEANSINRSVDSYRRAIIEIVGFWTPEYLQSKLVKIRQVTADNFVLAVSERLDCADEDFGDTAERVLWFKSGSHVYDVVELAEAYASNSTTRRTTINGVQRVTEAFTADLRPLIRPVCRSSQLYR